ncbi:YhdP family protein [Pseudorhizobium sp. NPDC055634]
MSEIRGEKVSFTRKDITPLDHLPSAQMEDAIVVHCPPPRSRMRRLGRTLVLVLMLILTAVGSSILAIEGGIVDGTLSDRATRALNDAIGPRYVASVGSAAIRFDSDFRLAIEARDVDIVEQATGSRLTRTNAMRMAIDPLALLAGRVSIRRMEADGIQVDTGVLPSGEPMSLSQVRVDKLPDLLEQVFQRLDEARGLMARTATRSIRISGVEILLPAAPGRKSLALRVDNMNLEHSGPGEIAVTGEVKLDGEPARLVARASVVDGVTSGLSATLSGLEVSPFLLRRADDGAPRDGVQGAIDVDLSAVRARESTRPSITAALRQSPGLFYFDGIAQELSGGSIKAAYDFSKHSLELLQSEVRFGPTTVPFVGAVIDLNRLFPEETRPGFGINLLVSGGRAVAEGSAEEPTTFDLRAGGRYLSADRELQFDDMMVSSPQGTMAGSLKVQFGAQSPEISFGARLPSMQVTGVKQLWPFWMARKAREWAAQNMFGGTVTNGSLAVFIPAGRMKGPGHPLELGEDELQISFSIDNARMNLPGQIPPLRDIEGRFDLRGELMTVDIASAESYFPSGRSVAIGQSRFVLPSTYSRPLMGDLSLQVSGAADAIAELASFQPLNALKHTEFTPQDFSGTATANVTARFGLITQQEPPPPTWNAEISLDEVDLMQDVAGRSISDITGLLRIDPQAARLEAKAAIDEVPAEIALVEPVGTDSLVTRERTIKATLGNGQRDVLAPGLDDLVDGTVKVEVRQLADDRQSLDLDLTNATLSVPGIGWSKGSGIAARATFEVARDGETDRVENFELDGEGFGAQGSLTLQDGALQTAQFSRMKLSPSDDFAVSVKRQRGGLHVTVTGSSADMRPVLQQLRSPAMSHDEDMNATVELKLDEAIGFNDEKLRNVSMLFSAADGTISAADLSAVTRSGQAVVSRMQQGNTIVLTSGDAGAVARFADLYNRMKGGLLNVTLRAQQGRAWSGSIDIRNFSLLNEARLQSLVSTPVGENGRSLNAAVRRDIDVSSAKFQRGFARIVYRGNVLSVENGIVRGEQIGATFQGVVRDAAGNADLTGTFMPAYGLNRIFGELPIIGAILGNGRDRGLIGITFKLEGPFANPRLTVNPLSIIAPGIFRQIFEFQ